MNGPAKTKIIVSLGKGRISPDTDGFLGRLTPASCGRSPISPTINHIDLIVITHAPIAQKEVIGITVDKQQKVVRKKDDAEELNFKGRIYAARVPITNKDNYYTSYPTNHFRLIERKVNGLFAMWEIAIVAQDGDFFLTTQRPWGAQRCYLSSDFGVVCPFWDKRWLPHEKDWPSLTALLRDIFLDYRHTLNDVTAYQPPSVNDAVIPAETPDNVAKVLWWNYARGIGALATKNGATAKAYWRDIQPRSLVVGSPPRFSFLTAGELVEMGKLEPMTDTRSGFPHQARDIKPFSGIPAIAK